MPDLHLLTNGRRGLVVPVGADEHGRFQISTFDQTLDLVQLPQSGNAPGGLWSTGGWKAAFGPTGLVVTDDQGSQFWVGAPTAD